MSLMPQSVLSRVVKGLVRKMERRHPRLFKNLAQLGPARLFFDPVDVPHRFELKVGDGPVAFNIVSEKTPAPDACIRGNLAALLDMLEGRTDGDTLFFTREIEVSGDTSLVVGLRNTLDREEIHLLDEIVSLCGPFEKPVSVALSAWGRRKRKRER